MPSNLSITTGGTYSVSGGSSQTYSVLYGQTAPDVPAVWQNRTNTALRPGLWPELSVSVRQATNASPYRVRGKVVLPKVDTLTNPDLPMLVATALADINFVIPLELTLAERNVFGDLVIEFVRNAVMRTILQTLVPAT